MKILMIVSHLRKGGPVDVIYNLCRYFCGVLHLHVDIVTLRPESDNSKLQDSVIASTVRNKHIEV